MVGIMAADEYSSYDNRIDNGYDSEEDFIDDTQFEDPEGFVDPMTDEELVGDILEQRPKESDSLDTVIIVDNVPIVGPDRLEKLKSMIHKVFSSFGTIVNDYYPEENGKTKGYIFLEFPKAEDAANAIKTANGYRLDKNHTFAVNSFNDFEKYKDISTDWVPPEKRVFNDFGNLKSWLLEPDSNDQYSMMTGNGERVVILQNGPTAPTVIKQRDNWTESYVMWSPKGTYMATIHKQGVVLWGGEEFARINRFNHTNVSLIDFSPCERYLVTFSANHMNNQEPAIVIWDILTGMKKRDFVAGGTWPVFKWSPDGSMVARSNGENLSIYESPNFVLLEKKSIKIPGLMDFSWSPKQNIIAYWVPEDKDTPARLCIMHLPSKKEIRVKNLFNVQDCKMFWQKSGDYLCVKVERLTKSKKRIYYNLELFRMNEKNVPVDTLELKDTISTFEWEPTGNKFCIIHGESPRISASFYQIESSQLGNVTLIKQFENKSCNAISWCPNGQFCVLAGLRNLNGSLEFIDTSDMTIMNSGEHFMASDIEWDPTGRYFMSGVSWWTHKVDNGYFIWSFQGKILQRHVLHQFSHFAWRPRPPTLLTEPDIERVKKGLKKYQKMFEIKDRMSQTKASKELIEKRRALHDHFSGFRKRHEETFEDYKMLRLQLREGVDTDSLESQYGDVEEETIEFFIREDIEIIDTKEE
ncbi:eukaryotic translation initiation factor 3 subunit B isoform X2 [Hydra vulgaris]|uniref:Eukaryotic translation initiation factor 3 subunit B n=1 Tax=Hydra vulgaris TaxID=6087 RepID=A0ABM4CDA7_HYDVU